MSEFSVKALLDGSKTMTRRLDGLEKVNENPDHWTLPTQELDTKGFYRFKSVHLRPIQIKPRYQVGDIIWAKETWAYCGATSRGNEHFITVKYFADGAKRDIHFKTFEQAWKAIPPQNLKYPPDWDELDGDEQEWKKQELLGEWWERQKRKSAMFMPKWASRIRREIIDVRIERLQEISPSDCIAEGAITKEIAKAQGSQKDFVMATIGNFQTLWDKLNGKKSPWEKNDWVNVLTLKKI